MNDGLHDMQEVKFVQFLIIQTSQQLFLSAAGENQQRCWGLSRPWSAVSISAASPPTQLSTNFRSYLQRSAFSRFFNKIIKQQCGRNDEKQENSEKQARLITSRERCGSDDITIFDFRVEASEYAPSLTWLHNFSSFVVYAVNIFLNASYLEIYQ